MPRAVGRFLAMQQGSFDSEGSLSGPAGHNAFCGGPQGTTALEPKARALGPRQPSSLFASLLLDAPTSNEPFLHFRLPHPHPKEVPIHFHRHLLAQSLTVY